MFMPNCFITSSVFTTLGMGASLRACLNLENADGMNRERRESERGVPWLPRPPSFTRLGKGGLQNENASERRRRVIESLRYGLPASPRLTACSMFRTKIRPSPCAPLADASLSTFTNRSTSAYCS